MAPSCHDWWPLSSPALRRGWPTQRKLFSVTRFVVRKDVVAFSISAVPVIVGNVTVPTAVVAKPATNSDVRPTAATSKPLKDA